MLIWYFLIGIALGIVTGLIPGLHPNTVLFLVLPLYFRFNLVFLDFVGFVVGISVTNTILNYIPSVLLGVPQEDTVLSVLPGHKFVLEGRGYEAIALTILGALSSSIFALILLPLLFLVVPLIYTHLSSYMHLVLIFLICVMLFKSKRKLKSLLILF
jgi:putative membrane protein